MMIWTWTRFEILNRGPSNSHTTVSLTLTTFAVDPLLRIQWRPFVCASLFARLFWFADFPDVYSCVTYISNRFGGPVPVPDGEKFDKVSSLYYSIYREWDEERSNKAARVFHVNEPQRKGARPKTTSSCLLPARRGCFWRAWELTRTGDRRRGNGVLSGFPSGPSRTSVYTWNTMTCWNISKCFGSGFHQVRQCCGSGSGIRWLFNPWIRDPGWVESQHSDPGSGMNNPDHIF